MEINNCKYCGSAPLVADWNVFNEVRDDEVE